MKKIENFEHSQSLTYETNWLNVAYPGVEGYPRQIQELQSEKRNIIKIKKKNIGWIASRI